MLIFLRLDIFIKCLHYLCKQVAHHHILWVITLDTVNYAATLYFYSALLIRTTFLLLVLRWYHITRFLCWHTLPYNIYKLRQIDIHPQAILLTVYYSSLFCLRPLLSWIKIYVLIVWFWYIAGDLLFSIQYWLKALYVVQRCCKFAKRSGHWWEEIMVISR